MNKRTVNIVAAASIGILLIIFALQNGEKVDLDLILFTFQSSLAFVMLIAVLLGVLLSFLIFAPRRLKKDGEIKALREREEKLEQMLQAEMLKNHDIKTEELNQVIATESNSKE